MRVEHTFIGRLDEKGYPTICTRCGRARGAHIVKEEEEGVDKEQQEPKEAVVPKWFDVAELQETDFPELVERYHKLASALGKFEAAKKQAGALIKAHLQRCGLKNVMMDDLRVTLSKGRETEKLDPLLLMQKGVTSKVIEACTVKTEGEPFTVVTDTSKPRGKREPVDPLKEVRAA